MTRTYIASLLFVTASLGACGGSSSTADAPAGAFDANLNPDTPPGTPDAHDPFACAGAALPTTAPASITITGTTQTINGITRATLADADVASYLKAGGTALATATSSATGAFELTVATGGVPLDGYVLAKKTDYIDTYLYPPAPLAADSDKATMLVINQGTLNLLQGAAEVTQTAGKGMMGVVVADCDGNPVAGATVTSPSGTVRYNTATGVPDSMTTATAADGVAFIFNVTPGAVTVGASGGGGTFRSHSIDVRADVVTTTAIQP